MTRGTVCPGASGWSVQFNICMRDSGRAAVYEAAPLCVCVVVFVCPGCYGTKVLHCYCLASEWVETGDNITPLRKHCLDNCRRKEGRKEGGRTLSGKYNVLFFQYLSMCDVRNQ